MIDNRSASPFDSHGIDLATLISQSADLLPIGIWLIDAATNIVYVNHKGKEIWGDALFVNSSNFNVYQAWSVPDNTLIVADEWAAVQALKTGKVTIDQELKIKTFDGKIKYITNSAIPIKDESGKITACIVFNQDITSLRLSEKNLASTVEQLSQKVRETEMFKLAVDQAAEHIVITDAEGVIIFANRSVERVTGYAVNEVMGTKAGKLWSKPMDPSFYQHMWQTIKVDKKTFEGEILNRRKNGQEYTAFATISPIVSPDGEVLFFLGLERDISQEKAVDEAKSDFVSFASHQLRTPLTSVRWYTEMLLAGDAGEVTADQRKFLDEIYLGSKRMIELVSALLNVSRIEMGSFLVEPVPSDILTIIQRCIDEIQPIVIEKKLEIVTDFDTLPLVNVDPKLMTILCQNLLTNAAKYSKESGKTTIRLKCLPAHKEYSGLSLDTESFVVQVEDQGIGIPDSQRDKIFDKLFRADNAVMFDTTGTGLGLYITKSIIEHSKGKIGFSSVENQGTTFTCLIPTVGMTASAGSKQLEEYHESIGNIRLHRSSS